MNPKKLQTETVPVAFDEYRNETLRRLKDEELKFYGWLKNKKYAAAKAELDEFLKVLNN